MGRRFGEMSTLMNYMYQSFNFRGRGKLKPYYDLIANIATEELGQPWRGDYVFSSGNLILDPLHDIFLENGARTQKLRVYEMTRNPAARELCGYLLVRGRVHALAYAKALEGLTGVDMKKMLPIPKIENARFPEAQRHQAQGSRRKLYRFSPEDYKDITAIWQGASPDGSGDLGVPDGPPQGGKPARSCQYLRGIRAGGPRRGDLRDRPEALQPGRGVE